MTRRVTSTGTTVAVAMLLVAGCANPTSSDSARASNNEGDGPVTVRSCGHSETFEDPPERVVVNATSLVEELAALGLSDRIVGYAPVSAFSPLKEYQQAVADTPTLGEGPLSREVVAEQDPDLVYSQLNYDDDMIEQYAPLDIPVLFPRKACSEDVPTDTHGDRDYVAGEYQDIAELGQIFHVPDKAKALITSLKQDMAQARDEAKGHSSVTVANIGFYSGVDKPFSVADGDGIMGQLIRVAGGRNVYDDVHSGDSNTEMGPESLIARNPEVIIIRDLPSDGGGFDQVRKFLRTDPRFADLPAVKHDRFVPMKVEEWYAGIQFPNAAQRFAHAFHHDPE